MDRVSQRYVRTASLSNDSRDAFLKELDLTILPIISSISASAFFDNQKKCRKIDIEISFKSNVFPDFKFSTSPINEVWLQAGLVFQYLGCNSYSSPFTDAPKTSVCEQQGHVVPCDFAHHNHQLKMILSWLRQWMHAWFWCTRDSCSQNWNCGLYNCFVVRSLVTLFSAYHCWCSCILWRLRANGPLCYCISLITELSCQLDASIAVCISDDSHI